MPIRPSNQRFVALAKNSTTIPDTPSSVNTPSFKNKFQPSAEYLLQYDLSTKEDHTGNKCLWLIAHGKNVEATITVKRTKTDYATEQRFWAYLALSKDESDPVTAFTVWDTKPKILAKSTPNEPPKNQEHIPILEMVKIIADQADPVEVESTVGVVTVSGSYNDNDRQVKIDSNGAIIVFHVDKKGQIAFDIQA